MYKSEPTQTTKAIIRMKTKKKVLTPSQRKIAEVMHEIKEGLLHSGKSHLIVTNPKQAKPIVLNEFDDLEEITANLK